MALTTKQSRYVSEFIRAQQAGESNPARVAVRLAYPTATKGTQTVIASQLRHNPRIQREIASRVSNPDELIRGYLQIANDPKSSPNLKFKALEKISILTERRDTESQNQRTTSLAEAHKTEGKEFNLSTSNVRLAQQESELPPEFVAAVMASAAREMMPTPVRTEIEKHDAQFHSESSPLQGPATPVHPMLPDMLSGRNGTSSEPASSRSEDFETKQ